MNVVNILRGRPPTQLCSFRFNFQELGRQKQRQLVTKQMF